MQAEEIVDIVKSHAQVMPVGGQSKPALSHLPDGVTAVDMTKLSGIVEYEPDEYTITAKAGTPLKTLREAVNSNGQYLPFDPLFVADGGTIGGTIAANTGGSGRFRYGGVRDFILGIYFVDGCGNIVRGGGKVVKNASGFDLPKFMVGSMGRYGILTEVTLKVFPKPAAYKTLELTFNSLEDAVNGTFAIANQPFEMDALDFRRARRDGRETTMWIRLGGLAASLPDRIERLTSWLKENTAVQAIEQQKEDQVHWDGINQARWAESDQALVKIPVSPRQLQALDTCEAITQAHYYAAGNGALITVTDTELLNDSLNRLKLSGLVLRGESTSPILGNKSWIGLANRVKAALDPENKFLGM
ncbi:MAG: FAD-binding protein [Chloroflexota bacterium]